MYKQLNPYGVHGSCGATRCFKYQSYYGWHRSLVEHDNGLYGGMNKQCRKCLYWENQPKFLECGDFNKPRTENCNDCGYHDDCIEVYEKIHGKDNKDYIKKICAIVGIDDIGELSDGFHTFNSLYHQRAVLFATIVNQNKSISWKTHKHEDGEPCFGGGWFLVAIDTPEGTYGYHYEDKYWDMFQCEELDKSKPWDGYTDKDVTRLLSLS